MFRTVQGSLATILQPWVIHRSAELTSKPRLLMFRAFSATRYKSEGLEQ